MDKKRKFIRTPVDDELHRKVKVAAALAGQSIEVWLRETIEARLQKEERRG